MSSMQQDLRLAQALLQFTVYLEALQIPYTLRDLYILAYGELWQEMPGGLWLPHLATDEYVRAGLDEFYTLKTIFRAMEDAGLALLLDVIAEETARLGLRMGVIRPGSYRRPPQDPDAH